MRSSFLRFTAIVTRAAPVSCFIPARPRKNACWSRRMDSRSFCSKGSHSAPLAMMCETFASSFL